MKKNLKITCEIILMSLLLVFMTGIQPAYAAKKAAKKKSAKPVVLDETARLTLIVDAFNAMNLERQAAGLQPLTWNNDLYTTANTRVAETVIFYDHTRPDGSSCFTVFPAYFMAKGENLLKGNASSIKSGAGAIASWMTSPGHKANMLSPNYTSCGMSLMQVGNTYYWIQCFGG